MSAKCKPHIFTVVICISIYCLKIAVNKAPLQANNICHFESGAWIIYVQQYEHLDIKKTRRATNTFGTTVTYHGYGNP